MSHAFPLTEDAARNWLAEADPRLKIIAVASLSLLSVLVDSTPALLALFLLASSSLAGLRLSALAWLAIGGIVLAAGWSTLLSQAIFYTLKPRTALFTIVPGFRVGGWEFSGVRFYLEGAQYGLLQSLRFSGLAMAGIAVCLSTSPDRLLAGLVKLRVPVGIAFMAMTALRFLPTMLDEWATVRRARRMRGYRGKLRFGPADWLHAARDELQLLLPLLASALRRATALATAVAARGFCPSSERTFYPALRFRRREIFVISLLSGLTLAITCVKLLAWSLPHDSGLGSTVAKLNAWL